MQIPTVQVLMNFMEQFSPDLKTGCPFKHPFNLTAWEFDKWAQQFLPPIMPEGDFLINHRLHKFNNSTLLDAKFFFEIRPIGTAELIKLG